MHHLALSFERMSLSKVKGYLKKSISRRHCRGLCAAGLDRSGFRMVAGFSQHNGGRQRSRLFVPCPWRAEDASHAIDILANLSGEFSECFLRAFIKIAFADADDRKFQAFKGMAVSLAKEFTLSGMNECVRSQYLIKIGKRPGGAQQNSCACQRITTLEQF